MPIRTPLMPAADLITAHHDRAWPGNPEWLDMLFRPNPRLRQTDSVIAPESLRGSGLYAIFLDGLLIYIGVYAGPQNNLFGGSVLSHRWLKHVGTTTMRGKRVSINGRARAQLEAAELGEPLAALAAASLQDAAVLRSQGMEMSARKMTFAAQQWTAFSGDIEAALGRLTFGYVRVQSEDVGAPTAKQAMVALLGKVERGLVEHYKPPLNTAHNPVPQAAHAEADAVMAEIERRLAAALDGKAVVAAMPDVADDGAEPFDRFIDELPDAAAEAFRGFYDAIDDRHLLYFTHRDSEGATQARVARSSRGRQRNPFLMLQWRARQAYAGQFKAHTRSSAEQILECGFDPRETSGREMKFEFAVAPEADAFERLRKLCDAAAID